MRRDGQRGDAESYPDEGRPRQEAFRTDRPQTYFTCVEVIASAAAKHVDVLPPRAHAAEPHGQPAQCYVDNFLRGFRPFEPAAH